MSNKGSILMADDEEVFLDATADLLRREGYHCVTVSDGDAALERVGTEPFDLLISDLEMPGNADLALVRGIAERSGGLPVIILTGYPSVRSAIASIELPVAAYLTKPVDFPLLLEKVTAAVSRFRSYQAMQRTEDRLKEWQADVGGLTDGGKSGIDVFLALTLRNVMGSLTDLERLSRALANKPVEAQPCQLLNCPRGGQLAEAVKETVRVLEETKGAFKSKTLGDLRHKLELLLEHG
ncbi:MAG: response regulator [Gemmatimonadales bacterium]